MRRLNTKNEFFLFSLPGLCLILALVVGWLFLNRQNIQELIYNYHLRHKVLSETQVLEKDIEKLTQQKTDLIKGDFESERLLREQFKMVLPGERLIVIKRQEQEYQILYLHQLLRRINQPTQYQ